MVEAQTRSAVVIVALYPSWIVGGISIGFAGIVGLCTLHPAVQEWIDRKALNGINDTDDSP